jgi:pimeloyl-ACP methyl ester carboxylesterase
MRLPYRIGIYAGAGYLVLALFVYIRQRKLIYYPTPRTEDESLSIAHVYKLQPWRSGSGEIRGWIRPAQGSVSQRWLIFHGNAESALEREEFAAGLQHDDPHREVILIEYPGYDCRKGRPTEISLLADARSAAAEWAGRPEPLYLLGESLGGAVAALTAAEIPGKIHGLILLTPLPDLAAVGARHFPWLPVRLLLKDRYPATAAVKGLRMPAYFAIAGQDEVVPTDLGEAFYSAYPGPKAVWRDAKAGHNEIDGGPDAKWWPEAEKLFATAREP